MSVEKIELAQIYNNARAAIPAKPTRPAAATWVAAATLPLEDELGALVEEPPDPPEVEDGPDVLDPDDPDDYYVISI